MEYEFYADTFFLLNLFIDTLLLLFLKKVLHATATYVRLLMGGIFGAGAACFLTVLPGMGIFFKLFFGYGLVSLGMIKISFRYMDLVQVCRAAACLYGCAFVFGGILHVFMTLFPLFGIYGISILGICIMGIFCYGGLFHLYELRKRKKSSCLVPVTLIWKDRAKKIWALVDTGNSLYEPIGGKPVSVLEKDAVRELFISDQPDVFRAIPFHSIGKKNGILEGYQLSGMIIRGEYENIQIEKPMIGLFDKKVSNNGAYQMILHPALMKKQEESI